MVEDFIQVQSAREDMKQGEEREELESTDQHTSENSEEGFTEVTKTKKE